MPLGIATDQDIDYRGRKIRGGAKLRAIGTWPLKSKFYTYPALTPIVEGSALNYPPGYCHFGRFLDENYFQADHFRVSWKRISYRGRVRKVWNRARIAENHFLDTRVGNLALAHAYFTASPPTIGLCALKSAAFPPI